jgi:ElaB/YqjD/DUF883 family membrane-anchored ribosome-binding protein
LSKEEAMAWESPRIERADVERLLREFETRLMRMAGRSTSAPAAVMRRADGIGDMIATALGQMAERVGGRARDVDVGQLGDDALQFGNAALRKLSREVEERPLLTLAVAVGVGALAVGLLSRRG